MRHISIGLLILVLLALIPTVQAQTTANEPPILIIRPIPVRAVGQNASAVAVLLDAQTHPLADMILVAYGDGQEIASVQTDADGTAEFSLGNDFQVGAYTIRIAFPGTEDYPPVTGTEVLTITEAGSTTEASGTEINPPHLYVGDFQYLTVGQSVIAEALLLNNVGRPIANMPLIVYVNGERVRRARTDDGGRAAIGLGNDFPIDTYDVVVDFIGTEVYNSVTVHRSLTISPISLTIQTVPALPHAEFMFNGLILQTDANGLVQATVSEPGTYDLHALPFPDDAIDESTRAIFQRWSDSTFQPTREVNLTRDKYLEAGYIVSHPVGQTFVDLDGNPVAQSRITSITLTSSTGDRYTFNDGQMRWLQSTRINRGPQGLGATPIQYSVEEVIVDGSNVINRYQQRFFIEPNDIWEISLLLYYAQIQARDALFGFPVGKGVQVELPSGELLYFPYESDNSVYIGPMGRGTYKVQAVGASGMAPVTPVALSRDQVVSLKVLTTFDMAVSVLAGVLGALGLLLYGRPYLMMLPVTALVSLRNLPVRQPGAALAHAFSSALPNLVSRNRRGTPAPSLQPVSAEFVQPALVGNPLVQLAPSEVAELTALRQRGRIEVIRRRCDIILMSNKSNTKSHIANAVGYSVRTVGRYVRRYKMEGIKGLFNRRAVLHTMTPQAIDVVLQLVRKHPEVFGLALTAWTAKALSAEVAAQSGLYIPAQVLEDFMIEREWYDVFADLSDTKPSGGLMREVLESEIHKDSQDRFTTVR